VDLLVLGVSSHGSLEQYMQSRDPVWKEFMKITLQPVSRWPKIPLWVVGFLVLWAAVAIGARIVGHYTGTEPDLCLFHRLTKKPCPTCGTTRSLLALARGAWRESFLWNPMTMTGAALGSLVVAGRVVTAKKIIFDFTPREKRILGIIGIVILAVNWAWLMYSQP
jgi:Protein of unknown function (DUF2752)